MRNIPVSRDWLYNEYMVKQRAMKKIALDLGVSKWQIAEWLKFYCIPVVQKWQRLDVPNSLTQLQTEIIIASTLGDAHIAKPPYGHSYYYFGQAIKNAGYVRWIKNHVSEFVSPKDIFYNNSKSPWFSKQIKVTKHMGFRTVSHPLFTSLRSQMYNEETRKKRVTLDILNQLTPYGIAIWYMDDGTFTGNHIRLSVEDFTEDEKLLMCEYFKNRWNIEFIPFIYNNIQIDKQYRSIRTHFDKNTKLFINLVKDTVMKIPCMRYKIPKNLRDYTPNSEYDSEKI